MFNTYIDGEKNCQLKVGKLELKIFKPGDKVDIHDGLYATTEGIVIIRKHKFVGIIEDLIDKYGSPVNYKRIVYNRNPLVALCKSLEKSGKLKRKVNKK